MLFPWVATRQNNNAELIVRCTPRGAPSSPPREMRERIARGSAGGGMRVSVHKSGDARKSRENRSRTHVVLVVVVIVYVTCGLDRRFTCDACSVLCPSRWRHGRRYFFGFVEREGRRYTLWVLSDRFKQQQQPDATATPRSPAPVIRAAPIPYAFFAKKKRPGREVVEGKFPAFCVRNDGLFISRSRSCVDESGVGEIFSVRALVNFAKLGFFPRAVGMAQCRFALLECLFRMQPASESSFVDPIRSGTFFARFCTEII